jgi:hypothetical protein
MAKSLSGVEILKLVYLLFNSVKTVHDILLIGTAEPCATASAYNKTDFGIQGLQSDRFQSEHDIFAFWTFYHTRSPSVLLSGGVE